MRRIDRRSLIDERHNLAAAFVQPSLQDLRDERSTEAEHDLRPVRGGECAMPEEQVVVREDLRAICAKSDLRGCFRENGVSKAATQGDHCSAQPFIQVSRSADDHTSWGDLPPPS